MTLIGKLLSLLNLLVGLGLLTWAVTTFTIRPGFFDPVPEGVTPGPRPADKLEPVTFAGEKREAELLFRQANLASGAWGDRFKLLTDLEKTRDARRANYQTRLEWARKGKDKGGVGFFNEKDPGVIPAGPEEPILGPDKQPLKGADVLEDQRAADVEALAKLAAQVQAARQKYAELGREIVRNDDRLVRMTAIRDQVQAEAFYLAAVEVTVYETRETVFRRKRQLDRRLAELGGR
ncbi:MAG: hypothetical protein C0501_17235 [Isosphaera sp.]|nr:hypothetical protein [Isosphaera sp.]